MVLGPNRVQVCQQSWKFQEKWAVCTRKGAMVSMHVYALLAGGAAFAFLPTQRS